MPEGATYRRCRVRAPMQFRFEEHPLPVAPEKDYLVRVDVCGLCRSDLHFAASWAEDWDDLGHEFGGTVLAARKPGSRFGAGDRVAVRNAAACLECPACRAGEWRGCRALVVNKLGFSQYADCDERSLVSAGSLDNDRLALVEPANVALDLIHSAGIGYGDRVLVLGTGTLGLITAYLLERAFGIRHVIAAGRQPDRTLLAALGLERALTLDDVRRVSPLREALRGAPTRVLVTTPPATLDLALEASGAGARILTVGLDRSEALEARIDVRALIFKRARIAGVFAVPNLYFDEAVRLLEGVGKPLAALIRRRIEFDDIERSFQEWNRREHFDGKAVLKLHGSGRDAGRNADARLEESPCSR